jgi:hypothetical protein
MHARENGYTAARAGVLSGPRAQRGGAANNGDGADGEANSLIDPFDIEQQAEALYVALTMPRAERWRCRRNGSDIVRSNDSRSGWSANCSTSS